MTKLIDFGCRWEEAVETAIEKLGGGQKVLQVDYEANYQGHLDVDVLLNNGKVMSVMYYYGSCPMCDPWESTEYDEGYDSDYPRLADHIIQEATFFDDLEQYTQWTKDRRDRTERSID